MKILKASWVITCDANSTIIKDGAVVFDEKIIDVGTLSYIKDKYDSDLIDDLGDNSVIMPGFVNSHIHLEFSSNSTTLEYGNFMSWLNSVIINREKIIEKSTTQLISQKLKKMLKTGTTTIGAISSYGFELEAVLKSPINTVFFNEVIGSKQDMIDTLLADFKGRFENSKKFKSSKFTPAIAIHSPYSVHPFLLREVLKIARENDIPVSAHFLESKEEFDWLHKDEGGFLDFFKNFLGQEKAVTKPMEFLNQFSKVNYLSFTHCVEASNDDLEKIKELKAVVNHCPTSNRLLNNSKLEIKKLIDKDIPFSIGTDGLSSNNSLSMFDELRNALMIHNDIHIQELSNLLLKSATKNSSKALGLNKGEIRKNKDADMLVIKLPDSIEKEENLAMNIILHTKFTEKTIIGGLDV